MTLNITMKKEIAFRETDAFTQSKNEQMKKDAEVIKAKMVQSNFMDIPTFALYSNVTGDINRMINKAFFPTQDDYISDDSLKYGIKLIVQALSEMRYIYSFVVLYFAMEDTYQRALFLIQFYATIIQYKDRFHISGYKHVSEVIKHTHNNTTTIYMSRKENEDCTPRIIKIIFEPGIKFYNEVSSLLDTQAKLIQNGMKNAQTVVQNQRKHIKIHLNK